MRFSGSFKLQQACQVLSPGWLRGHQVVVSIRPGYCSPQILVPVTSQNNQIHNTTMLVVDMATAKVVETSSCKGPLDEPCGRPATLKPIEEKYDVKRTISEGENFKVVEAFDRVANRRVCVKAVFNSTEDQKFLHHEYLGLAACDHPNVMKVIEYIEEEHFCALVTEMMTCDLFFIGDQCAEVERSSAWCVEFSRALLAAVAHLHCRIGICHLDIKPENIFVKFPSFAHPERRNWEYRDFFNVKYFNDFKMCLGDFQFWTQSTENGRSVFLQGYVGTPGYMAPEIHQKRPFDGNNADMWSVARTIFITCIGFPPWEVADRSDLFYSAWESRRFTEFWAAMSHHCSVWKFPVEFEEFIVKMMAIGRRRLSSVEALAHPFLTKS